MVLSRPPAGIAGRRSSYSVCFQPIAFLRPAKDTLPKTGAQLPILRPGSTYFVGQNKPDHPIPSPPGPRKSTSALPREIHCEPGSSKVNCDAQSTTPQNIGSPWSANRCFQI